MGQVKKKAAKKKKVVKKKAAKKKKVAKKKEPTRAERNISWIQEYCYIPEGKFVGQKVVLRDWQQDIIKGIYDNKAITRRAIISFGRKNAKTTLCAFLVLLHLCGPEAVANSQLYSAAQSKDQAALLYSLAAKMVRMSPDMYSAVTPKDTNKHLVCKELGTVYKALSAEVSTSFGLSPVFAIHDELGQVRGPTSALYEAIETAFGAHENPLSVVISTQAPTDSDLLSILIDDGLAGHDPSTVVFLHTASEDLDPFTDEALYAANPALGDFLNEKETRKTANDAKRMPSKESGYRNLVLNQRVSQTAAFVSRTVWNSAGKEIDENVFLKNPVTIGLDLSARNDLTALIITANDGINTHVKAEFFAPIIGMEERTKRDKAPYDLWAQRGLLTLTPGSSVEYSYVAERLKMLASMYNINLIAFDRWRIDVLLSEVARLDIELPFKPFGQGFRDMAPALDETESILLNEAMHHGNHPILKWCASNAVVSTDPAGNRKLDKSKVSGRIDGMVALVMAIGAASSSIEEGPSVYESRGVRMV